MKYTDDVDSLFWGFFYFSILICDFNQSELKLNNQNGSVA